MVGYIVGYEQPKFSPLHLHALLIAAQPLDVTIVRANWLNLVGPQYQTSIVAAEYQPGRGGLAYALKAVDEDLCDVRFSNNLALFSRGYEPENPSRLTARERRRISRIRGRPIVILVVELERGPGPALVNDLLRDGPKGLALSHPMFAMHVLGECVDRGAELERDARSTLFANALYGSGLRVYVGTAPEPPDHSHVSPANALSAQWAPGSLPSMFYAELANAERISFPAPRFSEFEGEEDDVDQPASELPPLQEEAPEESS
jgi:hypothetical protein